MLYIHCHKKRNVNTIVDGEGADSNNGKLSFPAHEGVLRGKLDRWRGTTGPLECESQRGERTEKYSLPQM